VAADKTGRGRKGKRMQTVICESSETAGRYAAAVATARLNTALAPKDRARLLLATGQSQFQMLQELVRRQVGWEPVDAFHRPIGS
jgi:glucosamine-6-phosphate deaminase